MTLGSSLALVCGSGAGPRLAQGWRPGEALAGGPWVTSAGRVSVTVRDRDGRPDVRFEIRRSDSTRGAAAAVAIGHRPSATLAHGVDCWLNGQPLSLSRGPVVVEF